MLGALLGYGPEFLGWESESLAIGRDTIEQETVYLLEEDGTITGYYAFIGKPGSLAFDKLFVEPHLIGTGRGKRL